MSMGEVRFHDEMNPVLAEELPRQKGASFQKAQADKLPEELGRDGAGVIGRKFLLDGQKGHADPPGSQSIGIRFTTRADMLAQKSRLKGRRTKRPYPGTDQF